MCFACRITITRIWYTDTLKIFKKIRVFHGYNIYPKAPDCCVVSTLAFLPLPVSFLFMILDRHLSDSNACVALCDPSLPRLISCFAKKENKKNVIIV